MDESKAEPWGERYWWRCGVFLGIHSLTVALRELAKHDKDGFWSVWQIFRCESGRYEVVIRATRAIKEPWTPSDWEGAEQ